MEYENDIREINARQFFSGNRKMRTEKWRAGP